MQKENPKPFALTWSTAKERAKVLASLGSETVSGRRDLRSATASSRYKDILPNQSIRDIFTQQDYDWFRRNEMTPKAQKATIGACMWAYEDNPIANNVINMMADFASRGIRLSCKTKRYQNIYRYWFNQKVNGKERSEAFLRMFYKAGQTPVIRRTAKLKLKDIKKLMETRRKKRAIAKADQDGLAPEVTPDKNEIPIGYTILDPLLLEPVGSYFGHLSMTPKFGIGIDDELRRIINNPKTDNDYEIYNLTPQYIKDAIANKKKIAPLDPDKFSIFFYKKDDTRVFANPMCKSILASLITLKKMELADNCALDGAIGKVRIFQLGDLDHQIVPGPGIISQFEDMLLNMTPGGTLDLVTGLPVKIMETSTDQVNFLGMAKYTKCLTDIYAGLGVPPSLTGGGKEGGLTNNFISMKTLLERLQYGRDTLITFWAEECRLFQEAMGIPEPAEIEFDLMSLSDESAEKTLWLDMLDRNVISIESFQERMKLISDLENSRLNKEYRKQKAGSVPPKASPFHDADPKLSLEKIHAQQGVTTPSEHGINLKDRKPGEKSPMQFQKEMQKQKVATEPPKKGQQGQGRPKTSKDKTQRKQKSVKPRGSGKAFIEGMFWARAGLAQIDQIIFPAYSAIAKVEGRDLSPEQRLDYERLIFTTLCEFDPGDEITQESVESVFSGENIYYEGVFDQMLADDVLTGDTDQIREAASLVYILTKSSDKE
jgi:hypothetical protein